MVDYGVLGSGLQAFLLSSLVFFFFFFSSLRLFFGLPPPFFPPASFPPLRSSPFFPPPSFLLLSPMGKRKTGVDGDFLTSTQFIYEDFTNAFERFILFVGGGKFFQTREKEEEKEGWSEGCGVVIEVLTYR